MSDKMHLNNFKVFDGNNIRVYDSAVTTDELSKALALNDVGLSAIGRKSESLEDYFLKLTQEEM